MKLNIKLDAERDIERFLLIVNIGMMVAVDKRVISIEEAENYLYSPYSVDIIRKLGINESIVQLIESGCELEDVESLIPNKLHDSITKAMDESVALLRELPKPVLPLKKWID